MPPGPAARGRGFVALLAERTCAFAVAFACDFALRSSSFLAKAADLLRRSFLLAAPANCPCAKRGLIRDLAILPLLWRPALVLSASLWRSLAILPQLRRPALAMGAGSLAGSGLFLSISYPLWRLAPASGAKSLLGSVLFLTLTSLLRRPALASGAGSLAAPGLILAIP